MNEWWNNALVARSCFLFSCVLLLLFLVVGLAVACLFSISGSSVVDMHGYAMTMHYALLAV
jgi:hypothetical protein